MRKNGFTLIELLAVIVILAIIALIATPIILGIINDARIKANERGIELYASAIRNAVASYQLTHPNAPTKFSDLDVEYDGDVECDKEILYEDGSFYLGKCKVNNGTKDYTYGIEKGKLNSVCTPVEKQYFADNPLDPGYKYNCKVDPNKPEYTFYVLNSNETSVNLIMDSNIRIGGTAIKEENPIVEQKGYVNWISKEDYIRKDVGGTETDWGKFGEWNKGPITAIEYLQEATKGWNNVNSQTLSTFPDIEGNIYNMAKTYKVNARMPYYSEISKYESYLYDNLHADCYDDEWEEYISCDVSTNIDGVHEEGMTHVFGLYGYWTFTAWNKNDNDRAWYVDCYGDVLHASFGYGTNYNGVRPVINLSI